MLIAQLDALHRSRGGDWYYRTFAPGRAMAGAPGVYVVNLDQGHRKLGQVLAEADVLILNGACSADLLPVVQERKREKRVTLFEINDDVEAMPPANPLAGFFAQAENVRLFRRLALTCDAVQYSAAELERRYGALNARGRVFPNQLTVVPPLRPENLAPTVKIGWGGSAGHYEDMAEIAPVLVRFVQAEPSVTLSLMCSERIWRLFDALPPERKQHTQVGTVEDYYSFVATLDIGLAPNQNSAFNRGRSDVKFLEYAGFGVVPVVQRLAPYLDSVRDGETGFFFGSSEELVALLSRLVRDRAERERVRVAAHDYVARYRTQAVHVQERLAFYAELLGERSYAAPSTLLDSLAGLDGVEVEGRHYLLGHGRFETALHDGLVLLQQGHRQQGAALLREAARMEPAHPLPELFMGVSLDSEPELEAALRKDPRSVQASLALGQLHLKAGRLRPALQRFMSAAELAPGYEMPFVHASQAMQALGAAKEASEFERLAQSLAAPVVPTPVAAVTEPPTPEPPAWHLLGRAGHLQTLDPDYAPTGLLELIATPPRRVLDLGCFCGGTGRWLKRRFPACEVVGIEMLEEAAAIAARTYDRVHTGALEHMDFADLGLAPASFDAIVAADVLEHLVSPWHTLQQILPLLTPNGALYVSLPNLRNLRVLSDLSAGHFDYAGAGILDVTHLRFFTRKTAVQMLNETGFVVRDIRINPDNRLADVFDGKNLNEMGSIELGGLKLTGLSREDLLELAALQLYFHCVPA